MQPPPEYAGKTATFRRYSKLSADEPISLGDGKDPPPYKINLGYKNQPGYSRKCFQCGKMHDTIIEDTWTGDRMSEIDKCKDCLMNG